MLTQAMINELEELERTKGGLFTEDIVEKAQEITSALHSHPAFEWDVNKAARASWMDAARRIQRVYVTIVDDRGDGEKAVMRTYVSVVQDGGGRVYRRTEQELKSDRTALINSVLDRIVSAIKSYPLPEFDPILELVEEIREKAEAAAKAAVRRRSGGKSKGGSEARL
jgi:hypothetical protein